MKGGSFNGSYFEVGFCDSQYVNRLFLQEEKKTKGGPKANSSLQRDYSDRLIPLITDRLRQGCSIQERDDTLWKKEIYDSSVYEALFRENKPTEFDPQLSFEKMNRPALNLLQECSARATIRKRYQKLEEKSKEKSPMISIESFRECHAPDLIDDFYSNVFAVSSKDTWAISVKNELFFRCKNSVDVPSVFFKDSANHRVDSLITCVHWIGKSNTIFTGFDNGDISYVNIENEKEENKTKKFASKKITCATTGKVGSSLYCGTMGGDLIHVDLRKPTQSDYGMIKRGRNNPICGLALSPDNIKLAAGTNNKKIQVWDLRKDNKPYFVFDRYKTAIKAISWSPWEREAIFAGGGCADPVIRMISTSNGAVLAEDRSIPSQVTAIHICGESGSIVTCHGASQLNFPSGLARVWKRDGNTFIPEMELDETRGSIVHSALSRDKTILYTIGTDEVLRLTKIGETSSKENRKSLFNGPHSYMR